MPLEITGKLVQKLQMQTGTSKTGNSWQKQEFVIETGDQYPKKLCANLWGDKADQLNQFNIGDIVKISVDLESREYMGRWYTDVRAWKIEAASATAPSTTSTPAQPATTFAQPYTAPAPSTISMSQAPEEDTFTDEGATDDLPF